MIGMGMGLRMGSRGGGAFDPASLFDGGEDGYLASSGGPMFQEPTAETEASSTDAVGFQLETGQGAGYAGGAFSGLGSELVSNRDFATGDLTDWTDTSGTQWSVVDFAASHATGGGTTQLQQTLTLPDNCYILSFDVLNQSAGSLYPRLGSAGNIATVLGSGTYQYARVVSGSNNVLSFVALTTFDGDVDNATVKHLPGNHGTQATGSYKPVLQADGSLYFDNTDDRLMTTFNPTTSGSIGARFNGNTVSRVLMGSQGASDGRCYLALDASGKIAGGIGAQGTSTIVAGSDIRNAWHTAHLTWNGTTVNLYLDGVEVYSAAQSGAVNTTVPMTIGGLNNNGTPSSFWGSYISDCIAIDRVLTADEVSDLHTAWTP